MRKPGQVSILEQELIQVFHLKAGIDPGFPLKSRNCNPVFLFKSRKIQVSPLKKELIKVLFLKSGIEI